MSYSAVNGLGLALVIPVAQSLVADYYEEKSRGGAFGLLFGVSSLGARPPQRMAWGPFCSAGTARRAQEDDFTEGLPAVCNLFGDRRQVAARQCGEEAP